MKRNYTTSDGYDNSAEVDRNTTGTFDISDYGHGAGIYAFGIEVTGGTNYNDDSSRFEVYNVDENGNGKSIWETLSLSLAGNPEPAVTAEIVAKPMAMTSSLTVVPFAAPANAMMQTLAIPLFTGAMSTPVSAKAATCTDGADSRLRRQRGHDPVSGRSSPEPRQGIRGHARIRSGSGCLGYSGGSRL